MRVTRKEWFYQDRLQNVGLNVVERMNEESHAFSPLTEPDCRIIADYQANWEVSKANGVLDAAAIVFCHSIFEEFVHKLFELDYEINPQSWEDEIGRRSIDVSSALSLSPESVRALAWEKIKQDIERKNPLQKNVNNLVDRCKIGNDQRYEQIRRFRRVDLARLVPVDLQRQELVHRPQPATPIANTVEVLGFIASATIMLAELTANCLFGLDMTMSGLNGMRSR